MESVIASAVAVLGTLLGSVLTLVFQRHTGDRERHFARRERLRQERLDACSAYAGALLNYRRCLVHLWFCEHEQPPPEDPGAVRLRSYDLRNQAQEALFRVQMLTDDELGRKAQEVLSGLTAIPRARSRQECEAHRVRTRDGIDELIAAVRQHL
ncbi:hypothetical protein ACGH2B_04040 [Streptomyces sp. BBFR2]|uniref:hypothetical protein n=1 Tax=Streptomyces sp. BBFR2 TaxID=3372854 RepID=UPI0037D99CBA